MSAFSPYRTSASALQTSAFEGRRIANCTPFLQPNYSRYDVVKSGGGMRRQNFPGILVTTDGAWPLAKRNALRHRITMARK
jgi:hypothetical protein